MRKGVYILPNLFTTGNLFCGFWAIISVFQEKFYYAAVAILLASVFDILDGKVARLSGATSKFGVQYDSLADLISFGVAPALLAFSWALRPYGRFGWLAAFLFVVCGALRLARFNVMSASGETKYFKGLPIPAAATMIALTILLYLRLIETAWVKDIVILVMIYVLAFLMVSNIRYFSFKELDLARRKPFSFFIFIVLSMIVIVMEPVIVLFVSILLYTFSGPINMIRSWYKKRVTR
ncbi:MAG: CDP-diacylglycerol--serine O-phosphatidyltransferase [Deltaproteobacteria bacterium]|nr:CDP-diacylglycerol--serine O-phosphatidyltransferase [Deltaproteobacteria bacterium]